MNRKELLASLLAQPQEKARQDDEDKARVERISPAVSPSILAETSKSLTCPHCGEVLPESWRTDDVTSDSDNNDEQNENDEGDDVDDYDVKRMQRNNRKPIKRLSGLSRAQIGASIFDTPILPRPIPSTLNE